MVAIFSYLGGLDAGHQGSSLSDHHKTTGFGPFKLLTCSLLQKGRDQFLPKAFLEEYSTCFNLEYLGILFSVPDVDHDDSQLFSFFFL